MVFTWRYFSVRAIKVIGFVSLNPLFNYSRYAMHLNYCQFVKYSFAAKMIFFIISNGQNIGINVFRDVKLSGSIISYIIKKSVFKFEIYTGFGNISNIPVAFPYMRLEDLEGFIINRVFIITLAEIILKFRSHKSFGNNPHGIYRQEWLYRTLYLILFVLDLIQFDYILIFF